MKILRRLLLWSFVLILTSLSILFFLLSTQQGSQWLLKTASKFSEQSFQFHTIQGSFLKGIKISEVRYRDQQIHFEAKEIEIGWQYQALFQSQLLINTMTIDKAVLRFNQAETQENISSIKDKAVPTEAGLYLPQIELPFDIVIQKISIRDFQFLQAEQLPLLLNTGIFSFSMLAHQQETSRLLIPFKYNVIFSINELTGLIDEQNLFAKGRIELIDGYLNLDQLTLHSGQARIDINGVIKQQMDLKWTIHIPDLATFSSVIKGSLNSRGHVSGPVSEVKINTLIKADQLFYDEFEINSFNMTVKGNIDKQILDIKATLAGRDMQLKANGTYDLKRHSWEGHLLHSSVKDKLLGLWSQEQSSKKSSAVLNISAEEFVLQNYCLQKVRSSICAKAKVRFNDSYLATAELTLKQIPVALLKPLLSSDFKSLRGELNGQLKIRKKDILLGDMNLHLGKGQMIYSLNPETQVALKFQKFSLMAQMKPRQLSTQWFVKTDQHGLEGSIDIERSSLEKDPARASLKGILKINMQELGIFKLFSPEIDELQGQMNADLKIGGTLSQPEITGLAEMVVQKINIPLLGLELRNTNIHLQGHDNSVIDIKGQTQSGQGLLKIKGKSHINGIDDWTVNLQVTGKNFLLMNTLEYQIYVSPQLQLVQTNKGLSLNGEVLIPKAEIALNELPANVKRESSDAVVVGEEKSSPLAVNMNVVVKMGKDVHIKAFGVNAWLDGQMRVRQLANRLATANGELLTRDGTFRAYGQYLKIEQGRLSYSGGYLNEPGLNIRASKDVNNITVGVMATGTAKNLDISTFSSEPGLSSKDIASLLLLGQTSDNLENSRIYAGTEITDKLSIGVNAGAGDESSEVSVRYALRKNLYLEGTSSAEKSGANIIYTIEIE